MAATAVAAVLAACGSDSADGPPRRSVDSPGREEVAGLAYDFGEARARAITSDPSTPEPVRLVLEDGVLTFPEYESAVLSMIQCVEGAGARVRDRDPVLNFRGLYVWGISWANEKGDISQAVLACVQNELGLLDLLWKEFVAPSESEVQMAMKNMAECMGRADMRQYIPQDLRPAEFQRVPIQLATAGRDGDIPVFVSCARQVQDEYGLIGFIGESAE
jgi:hypothetical protein